MKEYYAIVLLKENEILFEKVDTDTGEIIKINPEEIDSIKYNTNDLLMLQEYVIKNKYI